MAETLGKGALLAAEISKEGAGKASPAHSNLFVGSLAPNQTEDDLRNAFSPFGDIESVLLTAKAGRPSGFVKMKETEDATRAIAALNGKEGWVVKLANYDIGKAPKWNDKGKGKGYGGFGAGYGNFGVFKGGYDGYAAPWGFPPKGFGKGVFGGDMYGGWQFVKGKGGYGKGKSVPELREDGPERPEPPPSDNLYVKHLSIGVTEDNLKDTFSACGEVQEVRILRPDFALECAALVRFASAEGAEKARTDLDGTVVKGSTPPIYANAQTKRGASKKDHVYLKNVPTNASEEKIKELLGRHGTVKWSKIMRASPGQSRIGATCAALFEMSSEEEVEVAVAALNDAPLTLDEVAPPMKVRYAENKAAKKTDAAAQEAQPAAEAPAAPAADGAESDESPEPQIPDMPATRLAA